MQTLIERLREGVADTGSMINTAANVNLTMAQAADRIEQLEAELAEFKTMLQYVLLVAPIDVSCHELHHPKKDQHMPYEDCPVAERYRTVMADAQKLIRRTT